MHLFLLDICSKLGRSYSTVPSTLRGHSWADGHSKQGSFQASLWQVIDYVRGWPPPCHPVSLAEWSIRLLWYESKRSKEEPPKNNNQGHLADVLGLTTFWEGQNMP